MNVSPRKNLLYLVVLFPAILFVGFYLYVAVNAISYPYQLEWMEGGTLEVISRIMVGEAIYDKPSIHYVPYIYTPLYYYISAFFTEIFGVHYYVPRLVSFVSIIIVFTVIYLWMRKEKVSKTISFLCVGLFAATFEAGGAWFHVARVDSVFLMFALTALFLLYHHKCMVSAIMAGVLMVLSFMTKQAVLVMIVPVMVIFFFQARRRVLIVLSVAISGLLASHICLDNSYPFWYQFFVFEVPRTHAIEWEMLYLFWLEDMLFIMPVAVVLSVFVLWDMYKEDRQKAWFYAAMMMGFIGVSYLSRLHSGGFDNVLIPAYLVLSMMLSLYLHVQRGKYPIILGGVILLQFVNLFYFPNEQIPTSEDKMAGDGFVEYMAGLEGEVLVLEHRNLTHMTNRHIFSVGKAGYDILRMETDSLVKDAYKSELAAFIRAKYFSTIITREQKDFLGHMKYYDLQGVLFDTNDVFFPVTGAGSRPSYVYVPKD